MLLLITVIVVVVAASVGGWLVGRQIKSPAQVAAETEPPEPSLITVPVEKLTISADVVTRGDVRFDQPESVTSGGVALDGIAPVITWVSEAGTEFYAGSVLYEVSGRPVFALEGDLPLFRDLQPGAEGEDVAQFQEALAKLGYDPGEVDGIYGPITEAAAADFYEAAGYEILGPTDVEIAQVDSAREIVEEARGRYVGAKAASDAAKAADARAAAARRECDAADAALAEAEAAVEAALASGLEEDDPRVIELVAVAVEAQAALDVAAQAEASAEAAAESARATADGFDLAGAWDTYDRATDDLNEVQATVGDRVPMAEIVFFDTFPLRIDTVNVARGDSAGGEIMRVSGSRLAIDADVSIADAELIDVGDPVVIDLRSRDIRLTGVVSLVADRPGTHSVGAERVYVEIIPDEVRVDLNEANVRITIPVETSGGDILAVPAAAIYSTADGSSQVRIAHDDGTTTAITVTTGLSSAGMVEVNPLDGELAEGDRVVVGFS
jgi:peptidoglycan hydrolase-like protein with peptidoglycan-binding domain